MTIQHTCEILSVTRNRNWNESKLSKTLEKISSGYRINRSGDDAAGLAISEQMRARIAGLNQAERNSRDGELLIQVGEGALTEVHALLQRAHVLAVQSSNGIYDDENARAALQQELDALCEEIDRIAAHTSYGGVRLFQSEDSAQKSVAEKTSLFLKNLAAGTKSDEINIVYTEAEQIYDVATTQSPAGSSTLSGDKTIGGQKLSDILKKSIVPQTVQNILTYYPAFSYLKGSTIGIGLEFYSDASSSVLAYVKGQVGSSGSMSSTGAITNRTDYITYTLGVNTAKVGDFVNDENARSELEATIAHEMIHAFMDEAATSGMFGLTASAQGSLTKEVTKFPDWFIEGMAQTASGPGNWLASSGGLGINKNSSTDAILNAIKANMLNNNASGSTASKYGTGYLACMYLGAVISGGGSVPSVIDAGVISAGLNQLLNSVIGGNSLDKAVMMLTKRKFLSLSSFVSYFNAGKADGLGQFVKDLLAASGDGRGGLVSGNLAAKDLTKDTELSGINLFELNTDHSGVKNIYPSGYNVYSGGASTATGTSPTGFVPEQAVKEYGDFIIMGGGSDVSYDEQTGTLTVAGDSDVRISMKESPTSSQHHIVLNGTGKITLKQVTLDSLEIGGNQAQEIAYEGKNKVGDIKLQANAAFHGTGRLQTDNFTVNSSVDTVRFDGGAVIIGNGGINAANIIIDNAFISGTVTGTVKNSAGVELKSVGVPWSPQLTGLKDLVSVSFAGSGVSGMLVDKDQTGCLWLDPSSVHRVTFTDSQGTKKTLEARWASNQFEWTPSQKPFTVTKTDGTAAVEGTDYAYEDNDTTLVIKGVAPLTISGGDSIADDGNGTMIGRIRLADNISSVSADGTVTSPIVLTLDGVTCGGASGCALDLGNGNQVTLKLADGKENIFTSGDGYAGISLGTGTDLIIEGAKIQQGDQDRSHIGKLTAIGGKDSAGIGRSYGGTSGQTDSTSDIIIKGGIIYATGGSGGAGIGGGNKAAFGNISITSAEIHAKSKEHGAGIGGGWGSVAKNGIITIDGDSEVWASSTMHGTGIGAGCQGASKQITIGNNATIFEAHGGDEGAGIGASWHGSCEGITIEGHASVVDAKGGDFGAGIGSGSENSRVTGTILIDTDGMVTATGGKNGVGIGSSYSTDRNSSSCGDIQILQGTVDANGDTDSTGIGAGRNSSSGNITIGSNDPNKAVVVSVNGGMTHDGGNILSYTDQAHTKAGTIKIIGTNTTVKSGDTGEGLYSTSGAVDEDGNPLFAYPLYLFHTDDPLAASTGLDVKSGLPLPDGATNITITVTDPDDPSKTKTWSLSDNHNPLDSNYVYLWMEGKDQKITINYTDENGALKSSDLDLIYHKNAGVFRTRKQKEPPAAQQPGYNAKPDGTPNPPGPSVPSAPSEKGIVLQIGPSSPEILVVPRFRLSVQALNLEDLDISTQDKANASIAVAQDAIRQVSAMRGIYGSLSNRLEHNIRSLGVASENAMAAESRIRDTDMAMEITEYTASKIRLQASQAMLAQGNQNISLVLQLLRQ